MNNFQNYMTRINLGIYKISKTPEDLLHYDLYIIFVSIKIYFFFFTFIGKNNNSNILRIEWFNLRNAWADK